MPYKKGQSGNPAGKKAGTPNKVTASIKEAFKQAFDKLGGADALAKWAQKNPTEYYKLASKLIPTELVGHNDGPVVVQIVRFSEEANAASDSPSQ